MTSHTAASYRATITVYHILKLFEVEKFRGFHGLISTTKFFQ